MAKVDKLPPWGIILLHLGACSEAIRWAAHRPVSMTTIKACPRQDWRIWLCKKLHVKPSAPWIAYAVAIKVALDGSGDGYGCGDGDGYGYGSGYDVVSQR